MLVEGLKKLRGGGTGARSYCSITGYQKEFFCYISVKYCTGAPSSAGHQFSRLKNLPSFTKKKKKKMHDLYVLNFLSHTDNLLRSLFFS